MDKTTILMVVLVLITVVVSSQFLLEENKIERKTNEIENSKLEKYIGQCYPEDSNCHLDNTSCFCMIA